MNVLEALRLVSTMPNNGVLLAAYPLTRGSEARIAAHDAQFNIPQTDVDAGFRYVLEKEDLVRLLGYASGMSGQQLFARVREARQDSNLGLQGSPALAVGLRIVKLFPAMFPGKALALRLGF